MCKHCTNFSLKHNTYAQNTLLAYKLEENQELVKRKMKERNLT